MSFDDINPAVNTGQIIDAYLQPEAVTHMKGCVKCTKAWHTMMLYASQIAKHVGDAREWNK